MKGEGNSIIQENVPGLRNQSYGLKELTESPGWKQTHQDTTFWNLRIMDRQKILEKVEKIQTLIGNYMILRNYH